MTRAGTLAETELDDEQAEMLARVMAIFEGMGPQVPTDVLLLALINVIELCVKSEHQLAAAQGIASALIANFGAKKP